MELGVVNFGHDVCNKVFVFATPVLLTCVLVLPFLITKAVLYTVKMMSTDNKRLQ